jgi:hypothetical protein
MRVTYPPRVTEPLLEPRIYYLQLNFNVKVDDPALVLAAARQRIASSNFLAPEGAEEALEELDDDDEDGRMIAALSWVYELYADIVEGATNGVTDLSIERIDEEELKGRDWELAQPG